jgi:hypothetical protein
MPSTRYYLQQAKLLLSWAKATKDRTHATRLRVQAARELEHAEDAREMTNLDPLLADFNDYQMRKGHKPVAGTDAPGGGLRDPS